MHKTNSSKGVVNCQLNRYFLYFLKRTVGGGCVLKVGWGGGGGGGGGGDKGVLGGKVPPNCVLYT